MNEFLKYCLRGFGLAVGFSLFAALTVLFAQSLNTFSSGDLISAAKINSNFQALETKVAIAAPQGAVMAFYLSVCPTGWVAADGSSSTPDLRGNFIRGRDDMGNGAAGVDPDGVRAVGAVQSDAFQGHRHLREPGGRSELFWWNQVGVNSGTSGGCCTFGGPGSGVDTGGPVTDTTNGAPRVGSETRPRNISLIFCMRQE